MPPSSEHCFAPDSPGKSGKGGVRFFLYLGLFWGLMGGDIFFAMKKEDPVKAGESAQPPRLPRGEDLPPRAVKVHRSLMGTVFTVTVIPPSGWEGSRIRKSVEGAFRVAEELQAKASSFDAESELSLLNHAGQGEAVVLDQTLFSLLVQARNVAEWSDGAFDPTLGAASRLWRRSRSRSVLPEDAVRKQILEDCGYRKLKLHSASRSASRESAGLLVDLGGIGKGAALDAMAAFLKKEGLPCFRLSTTSDILAGDPPPGEKGWKVRLSSAEKEYILKNEAVSTSGTTHQYVTINGQKYAHLIDPGTGLGTTREVSVSVIASCSSAADAGATALVFLSPEKRKIFCRKMGIREFFIREQAQTEHYIADKM